MYNDYVPPVLQRKPRARSYKYLVYAIILFVVFFALFFEMGARTAHGEMSYTAVIQDGEIITKEVFCGV